MDRERDEQEQDFADELVPVFERSVNYPKTSEGFQFLCMGLVKASTYTGISMRDIVERCREMSEYCPTDHDLMQVARDIKIKRIETQNAGRNQEAAWRKEYGPPKKINVLNEYTNLIMSTAKGGRWFENRDLVAKLSSHFGDRWGKDQISWRELFSAKESLGFPLTESERELGKCGR